MSKPIFPYYSFLHSKYFKKTNTETFYSGKDLSWVKTIEDNYEMIREEFNNFLSDNENQFQPYFSDDLVSGTGKWKTIGFVFWCLRNSKNCDKCKKTIELFDKIPGFISLSVSKLEPNSQILGHHGDTDSVYRCHLPIKSKGELPELGFQVGKEQRSWKEGELMLFNDAAYHQGWNNTENDRIILMIDIIKPEYLWQKKWLCSFVLSSLVIQRYLGLNFKNKKNPIPYLALFPLSIYTFYYFSLYKRKWMKNEN